MSAAATTAPPKPPPTGPPPKPNVNGTQRPGQSTSQTRKNPPNVKVEPTAPPDPVTMYESVRNRIAALEEEEFTVEEEERKFANEARRAVHGASESAIQTKYIELFQEMKRLEREHAKEKQKLTKDKDAAKAQHTKANQAKTKVENLARELQKENKRLREDTRRLTASFEEARDEINQVKDELAQRQFALPSFFPRAASTLSTRKPLMEPEGQPPADIVVKVVCKFRAELFFKINRNTKLSRLFDAWESRMDLSPGDKDSGARINGKKPSAKPLKFVFTHSGRTVDSERTPEEIGIEDNDVIVAVELMDLTQNETDDLPNGTKPLLKQATFETEAEAGRAMEELLDEVVRQRLKEVLRQYERREQCFEMVLRSKELELLLAKARLEEQKEFVRKMEQKTTVMRTELEEMRYENIEVAKKLQQCLKALGGSTHMDPAPAAARIVRGVIQEHLEAHPHAAKEDEHHASGGEAS